MKLVEKIKNNFNEVNEQLQEIVKSCLDDELLGSNLTIGIEGEEYSIVYNFCYDNDRGLAVINIKISDEEDEDDYAILTIQADLYTLLKNWEGVEVFVNGEPLTPTLSPCYS